MAEEEEKDNVLPLRKMSSKRFSKSGGALLGVGKEEESIFQQQVSSRQTIAELSQLKRKSTWVARATASEGSTKQTERYFENQETGETTWERPDDYLSEEEAELVDDKERMKFTLEDPLETSFLKIDIVGDEAAKERNLFVAGSKNVIASVEGRLEQLHLLMRYVGTSTEWDNLIHQYDFQLPRLLWQYWGEKTTAKARLSIAQLFVVISKLRPEIFCFFVGTQWGPDKYCLIRNFELGVGECLHKRDKVEQASSLLAYLTILYKVYHARHSDGVPTSAIVIKENLIEELFEIMAKQPEEVFLAAAKALMGINWVITGGLDNELEGVDDVNVDLSELRRMQKAYEAKGAKPESVLGDWEYMKGWNEDDSKPKPTPAADLVKGSIKSPAGLGTNVVLKVSAKRQVNSQLFAEALIHLLNEQHYPYEDGILLAQMLRCLRTLLENESKDTNFFLTNDLKILMDICLLELGDLPPGDMNRLGYMQTLIGIVRKTIWRTDMKYHKKKEAVAVLDEIINNKSASTPKPFRALAASALAIVLDD